MEIIINNLTKTFNKNVVLSNISLDFKKGKIYLLSGENGSGKTTLLKLLCNYYKPTSGTIIFKESKKIYNDFPFGKIGAMLDNSSFFPELTGYENLNLIAKINKTIDDKEIINALKSVNLFNAKDKKYSEYSLGMKQKLVIAQAIMEDPDVLLLDEPFNALDESMSNRLKDILIELKNKGKVIILTTHIYDKITSVVDYILIFENGCIKVRENK